MAIKLRSHQHWETKGAILTQMRGHSQPYRTSSLQVTTSSQSYLEGQHLGNWLARVGPCLIDLEAADKTQEERWEWVRWATMRRCFLMLAGQCPKGLLSSSSRKRRQLSSDHPHQRTLMLISAKALDSIQEMLRWSTLDQMKAARIFQFVNLHLADLTASE